MTFRMSLVEGISCASQIRRHWRKRATQVVAFGGYCQLFMNRVEAVAKFKDLDVRGALCISGPLCYQVADSP
ncbi:MAG: hypothetical protein AUI42_00835 [Actinobacteria bacterium 13_1_40CM_2_65_8]|nr:MAG: hypothetical protein AUH40_00550 [Chloroflexi bacterium 13_1_40CM_65_17]OLC68882.1 MAG: hypothetical protein AUH69_00500 [Actinobacteria bacterium 13_1_40CM_4_65_12]OLD50969.1 MAG: hypothetical protein AUI42_00835 [Actinobacteria bacterium 13_1_40CM_2_65_8]